MEINFTASYFAIWRGSSSIVYSILIKNPTAAYKCLLAEVGTIRGLMNDTN